MTLNQEEIQEIIDNGMYMDYVKGRQCKFNIYRDNETNKFYIRDTWYDHTESQLVTLLNGASLSAKKE